MDTSLRADPSSGRHHENVILSAPCHDRGRSRPARILVFFFRRSFMRRVTSNTTAGVLAAAAMAAIAAPAALSAQGGSHACAGLPGYAALKTALDAAVSAETSGLNLHMWATIVDRDGIVCAVAF